MKFFGVAVAGLWMMSSGAFANDFFANYYVTDGAKQQVVAGAATGGAQAKNSVTFPNSVAFDGETRHFADTTYDLTKWCEGDQVPDSNGYCTVGALSFAEEREQGPVRNTPRLDGSYANACKDYTPSNCGVGYDASSAKWIALMNSKETANGLHGTRDTQILAGLCGVTHWTGDSPCSGNLSSATTDVCNYSNNTGTTSKDNCLTLLNLVCSSSQTCNE